MAIIASFIKEMEERSGFTFHQAQVALARLWIGGPEFDIESESEKSMTA